MESDRPPDRAARWRARAPALIAAAAVVGLIAWTFAARWRFLTSSPYPFGVDGYFYPIQLRSLLESGHLYYPASPLVLYWMLPFAALTDPITGAKLGAALGTALIAAPAYLLGRRIGGSRATGVLAAALAATSAESFYHSVEFVKQGVGLAIALAYLCALAWALDRPGRRRIAVAAAALLAAALAHKTAAALALAASLPPIIAAARARGWRPGRRDRATRIAAAAVVLIAAAVVGLGLLAPDRFVGGDDLAMVGGLFTAHARWTAPALDVGDHPLRFGNEVVIAGALSLAALALLVAGRWRDGLRADLAAHDRALVVGPALLGVFAALPWIDVGDPQGLGFRLRLIAFVPLVLAAAFATGAALHRVPALTRGALVVGFAAGWILSRPPTTTEGLVTVPPDMHAAVLAADGVVPHDDVIICPQRSLMFMTAYLTRSYVRLRPESVPAERRWRLLPSRMLHKQVRHALELLRQQHPAGVPMPRGLHPRDEDGVLLMPEVTWDWLMRQVSPPVRARYAEWRTI